MKLIRKKLSENKYKHVADYSTVGLMFPVSIGVGLAIGYFLDKTFNTSPYLLLIFTFYGIGAGFYNLFKVAGMDKNSNKKDSSPVGKNQPLDSLEAESDEKENDI